AGGEDVGQHQDLFVAGAFGHRIGGGVGKGHADQLRLGPVNEVPEDPAAAAEALPIATFAAVAAPSARGDARNKHTSTHVKRLYPGSDLYNRADRLVTEDPTCCGLGHIALQDV